MALVKAAEDTIMKKVTIKTVSGHCLTMVLDDSDQILSAKTDISRKIIEITTLNGKIGYLNAEVSPDLPPDFVKSIETVDVKEKPDNGETRSKEELDMKTITVFVKTLTGKTMELQIKNTAIVVELKLMIELEDGMPVALQRLIFDGRQLEDLRYLSDYNIQHKSTLHAVYRIRDI